jgi:hypothetical protein
LLGLKQSGLRLFHATSFWLRWHLDPGGQARAAAAAADGEQELAAAVAVALADGGGVCLSLGRQGGRALRELIV